ncbi:homoserine dehydrogenase [candidate division MSBL1 archaeon SCGC-AAA261D19]|uniref:homoserine dehydrogenase n=1 Tax=candidate division MSBL1 archaeon SCGC-AAA261D19 TaxID=1698273 RepID=A0A133V890_9EURY|nr:homoserine dehydrogenase [candidate division MSBL1 archaeon SCGC-AAA261D19]
MNLVLLGFGNIGQGFARTLLRKMKFLSKRYGLTPRIIAAVDVDGAVVDESGLDIEKLLETAEEKGTVAEYPRKGEKGRSGVEVIRNIKADVVFELTPTNIEDGEPGLTHIKEAITAGRDVITSNKGPLVVAFRELNEMAANFGVEFRYSASVGGAIPIIGLVRDQLAGDEVYSIQGVLNGTTNYILTRMAMEGAPFDVVLREAQELEIAEKDPTLDVEGIDTACKVTVLANALLDWDSRLDDVDITGIRRVGPDVTRLAQETKNTVKLVGVANSEKLEVSPRLVPIGHPLDVRGTLNAITLETDLAREISISGFGAGPQETSSALLGDMIEIYRSKGD